MYTKRAKFRVMDKKDPDYEKLKSILSKMKKKVRELEEGRGVSKKKKVD